MKAQTMTPMRMSGQLKTRTGAGMQATRKAVHVLDTVQTCFAEEYGLAVLYQRGGTKHTEGSGKGPGANGLQRFVVVRAGEVKPCSAINDNDCSHALHDNTCFQ